MKCRTMKKGYWNTHWILLVLLTLCFISCKDDNDGETAPYDPGKQVEITDFTPKEGGAKTRVIITGSNFGTDTSIIEVTVGGKKAPVINAKGNSIYCMIPGKVKEGNLILTIGKGTSAQTVEAEDKFSYTRKILVSTLYGKEREDGHYEPMDGTFEESFEKFYGVAEPTWFSFDPKDYPNTLYLAQDNGKPLRLFDLKNKKISTGLRTSGVLGRMRTITWTVDGDTMIIANDGGGGNDPDINIVSNVYATRADNFSSFQVLAAGKQCNGSAIHPKNRELYYNSYTKGDIYRYDYWKWGIGKDNSIEHRNYIGSIQDNNWEFNMVIHPTGDYAYIVVINQHYIMRANYNEETKSFGTPFLLCGQVGKAGWEDKVGTSARLDHPYQGVFVKNQKYVDEGKADHYDFYFCDRNNHCVRILTPEGLVTTFAGRGSAGLNDKPYGNIDGDLREEARFDQPAAIAYDSINNVFYIGDIENHSIRRIGFEEWDDEESTVSTIVK